MTTSPVLVAVFAITGVAALVRLVRPRASTDRVTELGHLVMSLAMVAMAWGATGGPSSVSGMVLLAVFGLAAVRSTALLLGGLEPARRPAEVVALVMAAAMTWMVATHTAAPVVHGPMAAGDAAATGHAGHGARGGAAPVLDAPTVPEWVAAGTLLLVAVLAVIAVTQVAHAARTARPVPHAGLDAGRHVLMSGGMAGMLLVMV